MNEPPPITPGYPSQNYGTTLVDRINLAIHLRRYLKLIIRRWLLLFVCTSLGFAFSLHKVLNIPTLFQATSELEVTRKVQVSAQGGAVVLDPMDSFYPDQLRIMASGMLRARVLKKIGRLEPPGTQIAPVRGQGSSFQLNVICPDPEYGRLYASNWAQAFLQYKKEQLDQILENKKYSFHQDIYRQEKNLEKARDATDKFRREHQIGSASDTYKAAQQQLDQLKTELTSIQTSRRLLEQTPKEALASGALADRRADSAPVSAPSAPGAVLDSSDPLSKFIQDSSYVTLRAQLNERTSQLNFLTNTLKPKHPEMVRMTREIAQLDQRIAFQLQLIEDKRQATIKSLALKEQGLQGSINELTKQVQGLRGVQDDFERLKQEEARVEQALTSLKNTLQQIDLGTADEGQFNIVGEAYTRQVDPRKNRIVLQGVGIGFLVGLALIYFLNRLDDRLELAEDIGEELGEPVLGQIPQVDMRSIKEGFLLITHLHRHNMFAESIRGVRSAIILGSYQGRKQALLVSSAVPGDGKTTFTVNFAATLAIAGNRVLLVDADLRRGNIHSYFKVNRDVGLTEVLMGQVHWSEATTPTEIETLRLIPTGRLPQHPGELLVNPIMQQLVEEARREFDYLIIDCPPLTAIDDAFSLVGLVDGLLFVVRSGRTSMRFAKSALAAVRQRGATILGIVLNGITADNPYYYYNYYYHSYYTKASEKAQPEAGGDTTTSTRKMAVPKAARYANKSIMGEAMAMAGQKASPRRIEKESEAKAELFKARRAARQAAVGPQHSVMSEGPKADAGGPPEGPGPANPV